MKISEIYQGASPALSFEFYPPKSPEGEQRFFEKLPAFKALSPTYCSMTYGTGGNTRDKTVGWVKKIKYEFGMETMCHLTCVGQSREQIRSVLGELAQAGIENLIALRGDPPQGDSAWRPHPDGFVHAIELVREAAGLGQFSIAVAGFPEVHPHAVSAEDDLRYLKEKVDAGADAVITQLFFDNEDYFRYVDRARRLGVLVPIIPGLLPIRSVAQVRRFTALSKAIIPAELEAELKKFENDDEGALRLGIEYASRQCQGLLKAGVMGLHFFTLNEPRSIAAIIKNIT